MKIWVIIYDLEENMSCISKLQIDRDQYFTYDMKYKSMKHRYELK